MNKLLKNSVLRFVCIALITLMLPLNAYATEFNDSEQINQFVIEEDYTILEPSSVEVVLPDNSVNLLSDEEISTYDNYFSLGYKGLDEDNNGKIEKIKFFVYVRGNTVVPNLVATARLYRTINDGTGNNGIECGRLLSDPVVDTNVLPGERLDYECNVSYAKQLGFDYGHIKLTSTNEIGVKYIQTYNFTHDQIKNDEIIWSK